MKTTKTIYAAFQENGKGGNPAGVVLDAEGLSPRAMQGLARDLDAPTTAFVVEARLLPDPCLGLRFYTPQREVAMCGHATVAAAAALVDAGRIEPGAGRVVLRLRAGGSDRVLSIVRGAGSRPAVELALGGARTWNAHVGREEVEAVLGGVRSDPRLEVGCAATGLRHLFLPFARVSDLARLRPDFPAVKRLCERLDVDTLGAFALGRDGDEAVRLRDFSAPIGKDEEAASGTTSSALLAHLVRTSGVTAAESVDFPVRQGVEMGSPSRIHVRWTPNGSVEVGGAGGSFSVRGTAAEVARTAHSFPSALETRSA